MNCILAIDGGGTRTRAGLYTAEGELVAEGETGPTNLTANAPTPVAQAIADLGKRLAKQAQSEISTVAAAISGAGRSNNASVAADKLAALLQVSNVLIASDALALYFANCSQDRPLLVIAGTGSSVIAHGENGSPIIVGGLGPILGDEGSAYQIAIEAIRRANDDAELLEALKDAADVRNYDRFILWVEFEPKERIAALATVVMNLARDGNAQARNCIKHQASLLAEQTRTAAMKAGLVGEAREKPGTVMVQGGLFTEASPYWDYFAEALETSLPGAILEEAPLKGHRAALELALASNLPEDVRRSDGSASDDLPGTEQSSEDTMPLEMLSEKISLAMSTHESYAAYMVSHSAASIGEAIDAAASALGSGGRIIYIGAGTSGRLGVLDASECPPTFGVSEGRVVALIAGGDKALRHSIEGAEDDENQAMRDLETLDPTPNSSDIVIGITASGTTPYVLAALKKAQELGTKTAVICCNSVPLHTADIIIALDTGPEILPGSTRLKAGTATKMVLNQISTGAMAKAGYVFEGLMVGVRPVNAKLRRRCIRIVSELTGRPHDASETLLDEAEGSIPVTIMMARKNVDAEEARNKLEAARGNLRAALEAS